MILKKGSRGQSVFNLQKALGLKGDGIFGEKTEEAVKSFQKRKGLTADGIAGPRTFKELGLDENARPLPASLEPSIDEKFDINSLNLSSLENLIPKHVLDQIPTTAARFGITSKIRLAHFLSQCAHESANFTLVYENLNYSTDALLRVFKSYFPSRSLADKYARKPLMIGSRVYGSRMGNGPENTYEGYKYRGRGYIQLTGKFNYTEFSKFIGEDTVTHPDLVATKYPLSSAAFFFQKKGIWKVCDRGPSDVVVTDVTRMVNGGLNGLSDRFKYFKKFYTALTS